MQLLCNTCFHGVLFTVKSIVTHHISHYCISFAYFFQLIKQSQMILNLLAMENKITNEHIDCIWAASQVGILW